MLVLLFLLLVVVLGRRLHHECLQHCEQRVAQDRTLMDLIYEHVAQPGQPMPAARRLTRRPTRRSQKRPIEGKEATMQLLEKPSGGAVEEAAVRPCTNLAPDRIPNRLSDGLTSLLGYPEGEGDGGDAPRLSHDDGATAGVPSAYVVLQHILRQLCGLPTAGLALHEHRPVHLDGRGHNLVVRTHRQRGTCGGHQLGSWCRRPCQTRLECRGRGAHHGALEPLGQGAQARGRRDGRSPGDGDVIR